MWGRLSFAGLLLAGCSFKPGGGSSTDPPGSDAGGSGGPDARRVDDTPGPFDAAAPPPDAQAPSELLETLTVQATGEVVTSDTRLKNGAIYTLVATGDVTVTDEGHHGDADFFWHEDLEGVAASSFLDVDMGLGVNDPDVDSNRSPAWGDYTTSHNYQTTIVGDGAQLTAQYHDPNYGNNSGSMTLEIHGPP